MSVRDTQVALLGAGGAARAIAAAMMRRGAHVRVVNRSVARAHELVDMCVALKASATPQSAHHGSVAVGSTDDIATSAIVVNATSVGMNTSEHPCDIALVNKSAIVMDAVYAPLRTSWLEAAAAKGATTIDGLWMLIHQAMRQQQWWFGVEPDPLVMRTAAERELAHRRQ